VVEQGMVRLDRNWRCDVSAIDRVLRDGRVLVVWKLKTRSSTAFGHPREAVNDLKPDRLR
jgi:putative endonuclease